MKIRTVCSSPSPEKIVSFVYSTPHKYMYSIQNTIEWMERDIHLFFHVADNNMNRHLLSAHTFTHLCRIWFYIQTWQQILTLQTSFWPLSFCIKSGVTTAGIHFSLHMEHVWKTPGLQCMCGNAIVSLFCSWVCQTVPSHNQNQTSSWTLTKFNNGNRFATIKKCNVAAFLVAKADSDMT